MKTTTTIETATTMTMRMLAALNEGSDKNKIKAHIK